MRITMKVIFSIVLLLSTINAYSDVTLNEIKFKLDKVLNFIDERYEEFHFDGLFGVTFAHTFLIKTLELPIPRYDKLNVQHFINKCIEIHNKILPLLPDEPKYMVTFRKELLDGKRWSSVLPSRFSFGEIEDLGYYKNWTADTIIENKRAIYRGVKSDVCLREILQLSPANELCYVSHICEEMMLDSNRTDHGYLLTHRLLYLQVMKLQGCRLPKKYKKISSYTKMYCSYIYKEALTSYKLKFPKYDIFLEQVVLCGMEGYAEFLNPQWLKSIMQWQNSQGCYDSIRQNITKRTSFPIDFGCSDHTTGLGAAALALHLRYYQFIKSI